MGYRSDVAYVIRFKDEAQRQTFEELVKHTEDEWMIKALEELQSKGEHLVFNQGDIKWYESYEDVKGHYRLLHYSCDVYEEDAMWRLVRIGEEYNDVEVEEGGNACGDLYDIIRPARSIELDL